MTDSDILRKRILDLIPDFYQAEWPERVFQPGITPVPVSGRVFDEQDLIYLVDSALDFWLTSGRFAEEFEKRLAEFVGVRGASLCNSGSSANLLAVSSLLSSQLDKKPLKPGDEVITVAAGFPTTVNPILQNQFLPVFLDIDLASCNVDVNLLEMAVTGRTRAIFLAHTLGNPFNLDAVREFADRHNLWMLEDNCDALGSTYKGQKTGRFGDFSTLSFYPAHHITTGEGGCVLTSSPKNKKTVESFRDWGRDCWCPPGSDNTCGKRFEWKLGRLPEGYDHKYIYSHIGYNLKMTDLQAAVGLSQLRKLPSFILKRKENWRFLHEQMKGVEEFFYIQAATEGSEPSWFGFLMTIKETAPFSRDELVLFLNSRKIATRLLFGGNLTLQPAYLKKRFRVVGSLERTDIVMRNSFWIGVYPGLTQEMLQFAADSIKEFVHKKTHT